MTNEKKFWADYISLNLGGYEYNNKYPPDRKNTVICDMAVIQQQTRKHSSMISVYNCTE